MEPQPEDNSTKYIIGIIVIVIVIIGVSFLGRNKNAPNYTYMNDNETATSTENVSEEPTEAVTNTPPVADMKKTAVTEIDYTDANGFTPDNISIKIGDTVKFVNKSNSEMWVASADHPTHTKYSGTTRAEHCPDTANSAFDQCAAGSEFSFTFAKAGTWGYHNHKNPRMQGTILVQ